MPNEALKGLATPNTGDLTGAWGTAAINPNMQVIGGYLGGIQSVSLSTANVSLSIATGVIGTGSITAGAGPVQVANAVLKFTGAITSNIVVTFPCPGFWMVRNDCTGAFTLRVRAAGTGNVIGLPPGELTHVYNDGTNFDFVDMGRVGSYMRLAVSTTPAWMIACTVQPFLPCVATAAYSASVYPALAVMLGSTFGGNGITTFGVPDKSNRIGVPIGGGRLTAAGSGIDGSTLGASGGSQLSEAHNHAANVNDPGHDHTLNLQLLGVPNAGVNNTVQVGGGYTVPPNTTGITVSIATTGSGTSANVQPSIIDGIEFIKT